MEAPEGEPAEGGIDSTEDSAVTVSDATADTLKDTETLRRIRELITYELHNLSVPRDIEMLRQVEFTSPHEGDAGGTEESPHHLFVVRDETQAIIGTGIVASPLLPASDTTYVHLIAIDPAHHTQKVYEEIVTHLTAIAKRSGTHFIRLEPTSTEEKGFLRACGFTDAWGFIECPHDNGSEPEHHGSEPGHLESEPGHHFYTLECPV